MLYLLVALVTLSPSLLLLGYFVYQKRKRAKQRNLEEFFHEETKDLSWLEVTSIIRSSLDLKNALEFEQRIQVLRKQERIYQ